MILQVGGEDISTPMSGPSGFTFQSWSAVVSQGRSGDAHSATSRSRRHHSDRGSTIRSGQVRWLRPTCIRTPSDKLIS